MRKLKFFAFAISEQFDCLQNLKVWYVSERFSATACQIQRRVKDYIVQNTFYNS